MSNVIHLHCRRCGKLLKSSLNAYCPPCNLHLLYQAMPLLLGMLMTGEITAARPSALGPEPGRSSWLNLISQDDQTGYDCDEAIAWE